MSPTYNKENMSVKYAIVENERYALENLKLVVSQLRPDYELVFTAESVEECVAFFGSQPECDLVFMDIELTDSNCFEIFNKVEVNIPLIFTTAYDEFTLQAFKLNSIDYLLKPIQDEEVRAAIEKFERLRRKIDYSRIAPVMLQQKKRSRLLVNIGDTYTYIAISDVAFFTSEDKYVTVYQTDGRHYVTDYKSLTDLLPTLDPQRFFPLSRSVVASIGSISSVSKHFAGRLKVEVRAGAASQVAVVSSAKKREFLAWLGDD